MGAGYFWRTFALFAGLILVSVLAIFASYRALERAPPEQRLAWEIASAVNLTRSALIGSDPGRRLLMLEELARQEEVRVLPLEPTDRVDDRHKNARLQALEFRLRQLLSETTVVAGRVNDEDGVWVSFDMAGDGYWLLLPSRRADRQIDPALGMILLVAALLAMVGALAISWLVDRPLSKLSRAIATLSRGEKPPPLSETGPPQLANANRQFNLMARELAALEDDRALALAGISHDLRSPLTRLRMEVELAPILAEQRDMMVEDIERIDAIVGQFIDFARINQAPKAQRVDAGVLLRQLADAYGLVAAGGAPKVAWHPEGPLAWQGDPTDLERAVGNLIDNALRHGGTLEPSTSPVHLSARRDAHGIALSVRDFGPGIPAHQLDEALRPFSRLDPARSDRGGSEPGTGLGLAIVVRLARRYGGDLRLTNATEGGLLADLTLPDWPSPAPVR